MVFVSGYAGDAADGSAPLVRKPFTRIELAEALRGVLGARPAPDAEARPFAESAA